MQPVLVTTVKNLLVQHPTHFSSYVKEPALATLYALLMLRHRICSCNIQRALLATVQSLFVQHATHLSCYVKRTCPCNIQHAQARKSLKTKKKYGILKSKQNMGLKTPHIKNVRRLRETDPLFSLAKNLSKENVSKTKNHANTLEVYKIEPLDMLASARDTQWNRLCSVACSSNQSFGWVADCLEEYGGTTSIYKKKCTF